MWYADQWAVCFGFETNRMYVDLMIWSHFLTGCLYSSGPLQGLYLGMDIEKDTWYNDIGLCAPKINIIFGFNNAHNREGLGDLFVDCCIYRLIAFVSHECWLDETILELIQQLEIYVKLEMPTLEWHALQILNFHA